MKLHLSTFLLNPIGFVLSCFHFHLFLCVYWLFISSMICWLLRSVLFSLHMFAFLIVFFSCSVQFSHSVMSNSLWPHEPQHARPPVHHQLPEFTQTHVHWVGDAIQPSHPLLSPSPPALNLSQHQGLFKWVSSSLQVARVLEFQLQYQSFQWTPRTDCL